MAVDVTDDPPAAMKEYQHRQCAVLCRSVEACRDGPAGSGDRDVARFGNRHRIGRERLAPGHVQVTRRDGADRLEGRAVCLLDHLEQDFGIVIERHRRCFLFRFAD
jgi:hypothetical protein